MKAFPLTDDQYINAPEDAKGMDLRDYFAAKAMQGIMSKQAAAGDELGDLSVKSYVDVSMQAYLIAGAMMEARK